MQRSHRGAWLAAALGLLLFAVPLGCGSEQSRMERGVAVDREEAVPSSDAELEMTEEERQQQRIQEEQRREGEEFEESQR